MLVCSCSFFFFFNDTATPEIYPLSLHDALPICLKLIPFFCVRVLDVDTASRHHEALRGSDGRCSSSLELVIGVQDRKSTRLNSSHSQISYAVFCLKKKKKNE